MDYFQYIRSEQWRRKADEAKRRAGYRCQVCNTNTKALEAHHRTYANLGNEAPEDITVLCSECHRNASNKKTKSRQAAEIKAAQFMQSVSHK